MSYIKHIRRLLSAKQVDLAVIAGVRQSTISRWEKGIGEPSVTEAARIILASNGKVTLADFVRPISPAAGNTPTKEPQP